MGVEKLKLSDGHEMPNFGLGTMFVSSSMTIKVEIKSQDLIVQARDDVGVQAMKDAIDLGYRHFDTAYLYGNEKQVGDGIKAKIAEGVVKREDVFVVTKVEIIGYSLPIKITIFDQENVKIFLCSCGTLTMNRIKWNQPVEILVTNWDWITLICI